MNSFVKKYLVFHLLFSLLFSEEEIVFSYTLHSGANLVSFPLSILNSDINSFFSSNNENLLTFDPLNESLLSIISEGELAINNDETWYGSLSQINTDQGYWVVTNEEITFLMIGHQTNDNLFFLHPGGNLISYPFSTGQTITDAVTFSSDILAIIGENEAVFNNNGILVGSLTEFSPGNGYWILSNNYTPFQYNVPIESNNNWNENNARDDDILPFNQSVLQSVFFVESIYLSGNENDNSIEIEILCHNTIVGESIWIEKFSDIIAMGQDSFEWTSEYCINDEEVEFKIADNEILLHTITGENIWHPNDIEIVTLSDCEFGDVNFNQIINISDIIIILEHILEVNMFNNEHKLLLSDVNQDEFINVTDIIILIDLILNS